MKTCDIRACDTKIKEGDHFYRIWNNYHRYPQYREYCIKHGKKIIGSNPGIKHEMCIKD